MIRRTILLTLFAATLSLSARASQRTNVNQPITSTPDRLPAPNANATCNPAKFKQMKHQLADWPNLARYRDADAQLPPPDPRHPRVVFMGDSITDIWGRMKGTGKFFPGKPYVNRGISGQTTEQMLLRFQQDVVDLHPAAVLILAGTNDIAGNTGPETDTMIENDFRSMTQIARANHIKVIIASITPAADFWWRPDVDPIHRIRVMNAWLSQFCKRHHYPFVDYYNAMAQPDGAMKTGLTFDGVHPNAKGFAIMAPLAEKAIAQALSSPQ
ncbi:MAG: SGNH/GDSL hydrolase family protein [Acidobacteriaceae bacterium]